MQRACAAALIRKGRSILHNPGASADDKAALSIIQQLGATVNVKEDAVEINSNGVSAIGNELNCGESGLSIRMFTSIAALSDNDINITGSGSLTKRPMDFFEEVLPQLDVQVQSANGFIPLTVKGPLQPKNITVDGSLSSQYLTGLLFAYAAADAKDTTITVKQLASKPYIDLTLDVLKAFGLKVPANNNYESFSFADSSSSQSTDQPINYTVEGDWSGAAFLLVAGAVAGDLVVKGLDVFSSQADKAILQALMQAEARISIEEKQITISRGNLKAFHFNATDCPDLFPPLVALASYCDGTTVIEGVHRLTHKESNRALTLQQEFSKLGVDIQLQDNLMIIQGRSSLKAAATHSHHDHRIAMACAVAALRADGEVSVDVAEAVNKSYPQFWEHIQRLGASLIIDNNQ
jgi:3-phosphoshikimate 1-carboxyvinyltransferase